MPEQVTPAQTLGGTYPPAEDKTAKLDARIKELEEQNKALEEEKKALMTKVKQAEAEKIRQLAEQVADAKISKKLLTKEKRAGEVEKLSKYSEDTLRVLHEELAQVVIKLSEAEVPQPLAPPAPAPVQLTEEQQKEQKMTELRVQLFGHKEPADEFYKKQHEEQLHKRSW